MTSTKRIALLLTLIECLAFVHGLGGIYRAGGQNIEEQNPFYYIDDEESPESYPEEFLDKIAEKLPVANVKPNKEAVEEVLENSQGTKIFDGKPGSEAEVIEEQSLNGGPEVYASRSDRSFESPQASSLGSKPSKVHLIAIGGAVFAVACVGIIVATTFYYKRYHNKETVSANGVGRAGSPSGMEGGKAGSQGVQGSDRKMAQSAQMYHFQHQKQQMIALEKATTEMRHDASDDDSDADNEEGDFTVYECPGLAPTGELEVRNPMFQDQEAPGRKGSAEKK